MKTPVLTIVALSLLQFACIIEAPPPPPTYCDPVPATDCLDEWACSPNTNPAELGYRNVCSPNGWYDPSETEWCCQ